MIARSIQTTVQRTFIQKWIYLGGLSYGNVPHKQNYTQCAKIWYRQIPSQKLSHASCSHPVSELQNGLVENRRTLSTTARDLSVSDKLQKYYLTRDRWMIKRKEFYQKFAAARLVKAAPASWKPFLELLRVDKPTGTWLLYLPCAFSICLATPVGSLPDFYYLGLFGVGAFLMRGAGCIINDLWDKDLDKHVERTRSRPLASGALKPRNAIAMLAVNLSLSLGILLSLNTTCILIGVASMIPVILYPLAKRVTYFPQAVLGITFNIGAIMGYAAVAGHIDWTVVAPLYVGCFLWTMYYDTIYAVQDAEDDAAVGIKSTALLYLASSYSEDLRKLPVGERLAEMNESRNTLEKSLLACHFFTLSLWMISFWNAGVTVAGYIVPLLHMCKVRPSDHSVASRQECWNKFVESKNTGLWILLGIIAGIYLAPPARKEKRKKQEQTAAIVP